MNLIDEDLNKVNSNKKIMTIVIVLIVLLFFMIVALLAIASSMNKSVELKVDGKKCDSNKYLISKDDAYYIGIDDFTKLTSNKYRYIRGNRDGENENQCYITNSYESTFFQVDSNKIYKILEDTDEIEYYNLEKPVIKEKDKIYMPISAIQIAGNSECTITNNNITINSIGGIEAAFNKESKTFIPDSSIVWETSYENKKLLKYRIVIIKDDEGNLGIGKVDKKQTGKGNSLKTYVTNQPIIDPKYKSIKYIEKFNQLIVETDSGKGIVELNIDESGNIKTTTKVVPQYEDIKPINEKLYLIAEEKIVNKIQDKKETVIRYGIINNELQTVLPTEYSNIGIKLTNYTNNNLNSQFIIQDKYIPVCKNDLWGLVDLSGKEVIKPKYDSFGCSTTNSSSNVLIIPELNAIVVRQNGSYGIVSYKGETIISSNISRIYKDINKSDKNYTMILNNSTIDVLSYVKQLEDKKNNTTNTTKPANTTNATNTSKPANATNANNTSKPANTTNKNNQTNTNTSKQPTGTTNTNNNANKTNTKN